MSLVWHQGIWHNRMDGEVIMAWGKWHVELLSGEFRTSVGDVEWSHLHRYIEYIIDTWVSQIDVILLNLGLKQSLREVESLDSPQVIQLEGLGILSTAAAAVEMAYGLGWLKTAEQADWPHQMNSVFCKLDLAILIEPVKKNTWTMSGLVASNG